MIKRENRIQEIKREELPWMRLKRGPDEVDEVITEMKRDAGEWTIWTRLKKENGGNNSDDGARTKKGRGRERAVISFTDWEDVGWIRMM